jgi:hypothetical protein
MNYWVSIAFGKLFWTELKMLPIPSVGSCEPRLEVSREGGSSYLEEIISAMEVGPDCVDATVSLPQGARLLRYAKLKQWSIVHEQ